MINISDTVQETNSAAAMDSHIPSISQTSGSSITAALWKTSVRRKDISAEVRPSLSAVKNEDANMLNPANRNENENMRKLCSVIAYSVSS